MQLWYPKQLQFLRRAGLKTITSPKVKQPHKGDAVMKNSPLARALALACIEPKGSAALDPTLTRWGLLYPLVSFDISGQQRISCK
jgi:hypothetical protein